MNALLSSCQAGCQPAEYGLRGGVGRHQRRKRATTRRGRTAREAGRDRVDGRDRAYETAVEQLETTCRTLKARGDRAEAAEQTGRGRVAGGANAGDDLRHEALDLLQTSNCCRQACGRVSKLTETAGDLAESGGEAGVTGMDLPEPGGELLGT